MNVMNKKVREIVSLILELLTGALSLMLASYLFKSFLLKIYFVWLLFNSIFHDEGGWQK